MKILAQTNLEKYENGKCVSLIEVFEMYSVITAEKTDTNNIYLNGLTNDLIEAVYMYKQAGGYIPE